MRKRGEFRDQRLYRRGGTIWCRVLGPDGRIVRRTTKCRDEAAASAVADDLERRSADPAYAAAASTTLGGVIQSLLDDLVRRKRSAATQKIAQQKTGHFLRMWGADLPILHVNGPRVTEYIDRRQAEGASAFTVKKELMHLTQALRIARFNKVFFEDVETVIPPFFSGGHKPRQRWPTVEEMRRLLPQLEKRRAAHVLYILATGARLSESFRARRRDADFERGVVHVHGTKTERADDDVPITPVNEPLLRMALADAPGKDVLFHPWAQLHRDLAAACVRAGIPKVTPNDLRRGFAHWHRLAGVDVTHVAGMLRHTTDKLAQTTYAKVTGEQLRTLVSPQIRDVPNLYLESPQTGTNGEVPDVQNSEKASEDAAPPRRLERPANGLGNLPREEPRSSGNKAAWARRKATECADSVPDRAQIAKRVTDAAFYAACGNADGALADLQRLLADLEGGRS